MKLEELARQKIDQLLELAGWVIQDHKELNLSVSQGVAVREFPLKTGFADYLLFVNKKAFGVIEAKPEGTTLSGTADQSDKYLFSLPPNLPCIYKPLPFAYESTGVETFFRDTRDPDARSRRVFAFHQPKTLAEWANQKDTLRSRLKEFPKLHTESLRQCQIEAIQNLEKSFTESRPRSLIQMATGSGKSFTAVSFVYRLIKFAKAKRILFLVDRSTLGRQAFNEFQQYRTPDDGRKFTELYNVQHLKSNTFDPVSRVCITTIQRLYSMLRGEKDIDENLEELSGFEVLPLDSKPKDITYNPQVPIETFDFVITDECHRSIYNLWRQVLEYFDAFIVGLTATPSKQTLGFFNQNLVMEYSHERAVADGVNVGYEVYRIKTEITEKGSTVEAGYFIDKRDKLTRDIQWQQLDEDLAYEASQLDRDVVAVDQIRTVIKTIKEKFFTDIFPNRTEVPKTLIFAKDDSHAEDIVHIVREEFGKGNEFCKKITYRTTGETPESLITSFRNSYNPRIAVTVDMISTGSNIKPLECLLFMRNINSSVYFDQMKGRGTRTISPTELEAVTPGAKHKTHFVIVDAVGVCERDKTDTRPLERNRSISLEKILTMIATGVRETDILTSLAGRLTKLDREITDKDRKEIQDASGGKSLSGLVNGLLDALDPEKHLQKAKELFNTKSPNEDQVKTAAEQIMDTACSPFDDPALRNKIIEIKKKSEQVIDTVSIDILISAGFDQAAKEKAESVVGKFKKFIEENKDEITALQIFFNKPYGQRHFTFDQIKQLAESIEKPPYHLTQDQLWNAFEVLEKAKSKGAGSQKLLTNMISLIRVVLGEMDVLEPYPDTVNHRFEEWLSQQKELGRNFTDEQVEWLTMIKDHISTSLSIDLDDFDYTPFNAKGGKHKVYQLFGAAFGEILSNLNEVLAA
jgi:type I restriction enzyme R subunit